MSQKIYPFKFLDAYNREDKDIFFGRDAEIEQLYDMIFQTDLLVVYGASGTGKSSLIQCGLANRFQSHDWLPIPVRRGQNINDSLEKALKDQAPLPTTDDNLDWLNQSWDDSHSPTDSTPQNPLARTFKDIYLHYFRPIFLIFDQFEELYVLGTRAEQETFVHTVRDILRIEQPIKILISIREEYLGHLYEFEKAVPELLRKKLRVEPMNLAKVSTVIGGLAALPNSLVQISHHESDALAEDIFEKIKDNEKTITIQLPYLQVFLDKFYLHVSNDDTRQTEAHLTLDAIAEMGDLGDILRNFLDDQVLKMAKDLHILPDKVWQLLSPLVTLEGTKEPITAEALTLRLPDMPPDTLHNALQAFVGSRILRYNEQGQVYEVAHDALAKQIHAKRSDEDIAILEVQRLIKSQVLLKAAVRDYFTEKQLLFIEPYLAKFTPSVPEADWIAQSRQFRTKEKAEEERRKTEELQIARDTAEREKHLRQAAETQQNIAKWRSRIAIAVSFLALMASGLAFWQYQKAEAQTKEAETAQQKTQTVLDKIYFYEDRFGLAYDKNTRSYGFIDKDLNTKIAFQYEEALPFDYTGFAKVKKEYIYYWIDTTGAEYKFATDINQLKPDITALDLRNKKLTEIPPSVFKHTQLKVLLLQGNKISKIPNGMKTLTDLKYLDLSRNKVSKLENLDNLSNLVYLNIAGDYDNKGQIRKLESLDNLKALQNLDISGNQIMKLEGLENLKALQNLGISGNQIAKLESLDNLKALQNLDISGNQIMKLEGLENLKALQNLNISSNRITKLEGLDDLKALQNLSISRNQITKLEGLENLKALRVFNISGSIEKRGLITKLEGLENLKALQDFNISDNQIRKLEGLNDLRFLKNFDISGNQIRKLEGLENLESLQNFSISDNMLRTLEKGNSFKDNEIRKLEGLDNLTSLQDFDISGNQIHKIEGLDNLKSLQSLSLSKNQIRKIEGLDNLKSLQSLFISENQIRKIEGLGNLKSLQSLNISENPISKLEGLDSLKSLEYFQILGFDIWGGHIKKLEGLDNLKSLKFFQISFNQIAKLEGLDNLKSLEEFHISNNEIMKLEGLNNLKSLQEFNISVNNITKLEGLDSLKSLQNLRVSGNQITKLEGLDNLKSLKRIEFHMIQISEAEQERIKKVLPNCEVKF